MVQLVKRYRAIVPRAELASACGDVVVSSSSVNAVFASLNTNSFATDYFLWILQTSSYGMVATSPPRSFTTTANLSTSMRFTMPVLPRCSPFTTCTSPPAFGITVSSSACRPTYHACGMSVQRAYGAWPTHLINLKLDAGIYQLHNGGILVHNLAATDVEVLTWRREHTSLYLLYEALLLVETPTACGLVEALTCSQRHIISKPRVQTLDPGRGTPTFTTMPGTSQ